MPQRQAGGRAAGVDCLWALACAAATAAALAGGGGIWEHVGNGDLHAAHLPWYRYVAHAVLGEGRLPLWDRHPFCGTPVLALGQTCALYPPVLVLFRLLPAYVALQATYALHAFVLAWGMVAYLRAEGIARPAGAAAALVAIAAVFRGPLVVGVDHPSFLACVAWIPVMLVAWRHAVWERDLRWLGAFALAAGMQWVAGYPEIALDATVLLGLVAVAAGDAPAGRRLGTLAAGVALGAALAGLQIFPLREAVGQSPRVDQSFPWAGFRQLFAVHSAGELARMLWSRYGPAALVLAALALRRPRRVWLGWLVAWLWALFAVNPPLRLLYHLPVFAGVRFPLGWAAASGVFLGCLAAAGAAALWQSGARPRRAAALAFGGLMAAHALVVVWKAPASTPAFRPGAPDFRAPDRRLTAERVRIVRRFLGPEERVLDERDADAGAAILDGLAMPNGHEPSLPPARVVQLLDELKLYDGLGLYRARDWAALAERPDLGALLGLGLVAAPATRAAKLEAAGFVRVASLPPDDVLLHRPAVPRVRIVHRTIEGDGEEATRALVVAHAAEALGTAVVETGAVTPLATPPAGADEAARLVEDRPERVEIEARLASAGLLVVTDTYYPGWRVAVDGAPAILVRADHAFRGVRLDAGAHRVVFTYAPRSVRLGAACSGLALVVIAGCLLRGRAGRRRGGA